MSLCLLSTLLLGLLLSGCSGPNPAGGGESAQAGENPFFSESALPFQAPPFDKISDGDYKPAIEDGMKRQLAEVRNIADDPAAPTFANTIEALERSGSLLTRVRKVFSAMTQADTYDTLQKIDAETAPELAAHRDAIYLDPTLFARVKAVYDERDSLGLDAESLRVLERYYRDFVRGGALLSDADKDSLRALNKEESKLTTEFRDRVLADTNASAVVVDDERKLAGLSESDVSAAAAAAADRDLEGKWVLTLQNTTQQPALASLQDRALRQHLFEASVNRGDHGGPNDTESIVSRLAQLRAEKAKLLGFPDYAAYVIDDEMAKTPQVAEKLLTDLVPAATAKARQEAAKLQAIIDAQHAGFRLTAADWALYAEKVRKADYDLDNSEVRPYFALDRVLRDGVFFAANQLYGLTFEERHDLPVYDPDVRVFEVRDADGQPLALYYGDYFSRPSKSGGAWMDSFVDPCGLLGTKAVVFNVTNFTKPAAGQPALLSYDEVATLFHEFGHALHGMLSEVRYPLLTGTNVPRDFVEFPSQFNEHWALYPAVLANYAKHYETGEPMPQALVEKIKKSHTFNQGYMTTEYVAAALLDLAWHSLPPGAPLADANIFEPKALERFHVALPQVPPRYHTTYFSHIWGGGYDAGYYAYMWSEVLSDDAWTWFKENGGLTRDNGRRFRDMILSRGNTEDEAAMYRAFRGRDPIIEPLLEERGLTAEATR